MRTFLPCLALAAALFLACALPAHADTPAPCKSTATGDLRLHTVTSAIFGNTRTIRVLLPDGYNAPANQDRRYPVPYMLDGQTVFDACLSDVSRKEWGVDETVRAGSRASAWRTARPAAPRSARAQAGKPVDAVSVTTQHRLSA